MVHGALAGARAVYHHGFLVDTHARLTPKRLRIIQAAKSDIKNLTRKRVTGV